MSQHITHACIFDLDGTLIDSLADLADAANTCLNSAGYPSHSYEAYRNFVGNGMETLIQRALPFEAALRLGPVGIHDLAGQMRYIYSRAWNVKTRCYEGIAALIDQLHHSGMPLAVLSNKPHALTCDIIDYYFPNKPFSLVYGARADVPNKPDPSTALEVAQELGIEPSHISFVGDSNVDIRTGLNAGMATIGVCWGFRGREELLQEGAGTLVEHPADIASLLLAP